MEYNWSIGEEAQGNMDYQVYLTPVRGLVADPGLEEFSGIPVCDGDGILTYANDQVAPCAWIQRVKEWGWSTDLAYYLNLYTSGEGMDLLHKYRIGELLPNQQELMGKINQAIYSSPRPEVSFPILRGLTVNLEDPQQRPHIGQVIVNGTPRSGSFDPGVVLQGYHNSASLRIHVPPGSIVSWHPSEDQVIFPIGARFLIISDTQDISVSLQWNRDSPITTEPINNVYDAIYIDAPDYPLTNAIPSTVFMVANYTSYLSLLQQDYLFPYRIPSAIKDRRNSNWSASLSGPQFTGDVINGIIHAIEEVGLATGYRWYLDSPDSKLTSNNTTYTITLISGVNVNVRNADQFLQGFISVTNMAKLDYNNYIASVSDINNVQYHITM